MLLSSSKIGCDVRKNTPRNYGTRTENIRSFLAFYLWKDSLSPPFWLGCMLTLSSPFLLFIPELSAADFCPDMLNCKINGTVHIFFLKKYCSAPGERNCPNFFSRGVFPSYYHVISDFCHIWGPFMAKIEKMCQKSAFLVVPSQNH